MYQFKPFQRYLEDNFKLLSNLQFVQRIQNFDVHDLFKEQEHFLINFLNYFFFNDNF